MNNNRNEGQEDQVEINKPWFKKPWVWALIAIAALVAIVLFYYFFVMGGSDNGDAAFLKAVAKEEGLTIAQAKAKYDDFKPKPPRNPLK